MTPFFSVIIPTLNEESSLPLLLSHLAIQNMQNFEVRVVDGRSDDNTRQAAVRFKNNFPFTFHAVKKRNVSWQRNYGAGRARGTFLLFLDADMVIDPDFTKRLTMQIKRSEGAFYIPRLRSDRNSIVSVGTFKAINATVSFLLKTDKPFSSGGAMVVHHRLFKALKGFNDKLSICEDHDIVRRAKKKNVHIEMFDRNYIRISLRRVESEGVPRVIYKFLLSSFTLLFKSKVYGNVYHYPMGGHVYKLPRR